MASKPALAIVEDRESLIIRSFISLYGIQNLVDKDLKQSKKYFAAINNKDIIEVDVRANIFLGTLIEK